ncbi:MarR family winged helix-turn-helix transcriptional regulator [Geomobilimonas luticola]|uniref:MarR family transcriptional regulator n=1 Tax=Geomobilimonas luticola TaxID=1114878 RepID=A0ABS5SH11_9BACT|nr:MarR family transcriptional regulator [Geomobilimonas luticola]MBT0654649.1 MarR family transcriptional regulator [Geomobilimonas luticola]
MPTSRLVADIIDNIRRVFQVINEQSKRAERETGLTGPQLWAIKIISESAPLKLSELARRMYLHPATVVGIIDRLEGRDYVTRTRSQEDRRVVEINLTPQGKKLVEHAPEVAQGLLVKGLEPLPEEMLVKIYDGLDQLVTILGAQEMLPRLFLSPEMNVPPQDTSPDEASSPTNEKSP